MCFIEGRSQFPRLELQQFPRYKHKVLVGKCNHRFRILFSSLMDTRLTILICSIYFTFNSIAFCCNALDDSNSFIFLFRSLYFLGIFDFFFGKNTSSLSNSFVINGFENTRAFYV